MKLKPTKEQKDILTAAKGERDIKIVAGAGAAKSTTLAMIAEESSEVNCLYLAYNRSMADEAKQKFPSNVECRSTHSLAYQYTGRSIAHKLSRPDGAYVNVAGSPTEISYYYKVKPIQVDEETYINSPFICSIAKDIVSKFENSDFKNINKKCIPTYVQEDIEKRYGEQFVDSVCKSALTVANKLWKDRINPSSPVLATHDTYLKLFELSDVIINKFGMVFLDESQDANNCTISIIKTKFGNAKRVVVGDPFQQIYQFRGSVNALNKLNGDKFTLSKSFRFGTNVGDLASKILLGKFNLKGFSKVKTVIGKVDVIGEDEQRTEIFRKNSTLIERGIDLLEKKVPVLIDFDTKDFINKLLSVEALAKEDMKKVKHVDILPFNTFQELLVEANDNFELKRFSDIVIQEDVDYYVSTLLSYRKPSNYRVHLITAHRSKGLEWDNVMLGDDFPSIYDKEGKLVWLNELEENLLYVAATRCKKKLKYNSTVDEILQVLEKKTESSYNISVTKVEDYMLYDDPVLNKIMNDAVDDEENGDIMGLSFSKVNDELRFYSQELDNMTYRK